MAPGLQDKQSCELSLRKCSQPCAAKRDPAKGLDMASGVEEVTGRQQKTAFHSQGPPRSASERAAGPGTSTEERERPRLTLGGIVVN